MPATAFGPNAVADAAYLVQEPQRDVAKRAGLINMIKTKILGNEIQRRQFLSLLRRFELHNITEETRLAIVTAAALRVTASQAVTNAIQTGDDCVMHFDPTSPAAEVGWQMLEKNRSISFRSLTKRRNAASIDHSGQ
ncbi:MAG: hypothetical protein R2839_03540 [Thermomicrobiales bacterium]